LLFNTKIKQTLQAESHNFILWLLVFFCFGSFTAVVSFDNISPLKLAFSFILLCFSGFLYYFSKKNAASLVFTAFFLGFILSFFAQKISNSGNEITGKIFVDVSAKVADLSEFHNSKNHQSGLSLLLDDLTLKKSAFVGKKVKSKPKKIKEKLMNSDGLMEVDYEYLLRKNNYQDVLWKKENGQFLYPNPPKKIRIFATKFEDEIKIGDVVKFRAILMPAKKQQFLGGFDFAFYSRSKSIGAQGYALSQVEVVESASLISPSFIDAFFKNLRMKVQKSILQNAKKSEAPFINALLTGDRSKIPKDEMQNIRNSGLAHLIAISGLHLSLSAAIFFFLARFLCVKSEFLALRFDIKKIAAIFAILGSFFYLKIAGSPISAQRAFVMVCLAMSAVFLDRKTDLKRIVFFAGFLIVLLNPFNMFFASFQLSFAAVLGIVAFHDLWVIFCEKEQVRNFILIKNKFWRGFCEMILISLVAQIANMAFLIYHFGDVAIYGILSNLVAIPLTSFVIMPLGFLAIFLMIFGDFFAQIALIPMSWAVSLIVITADFVANLKYSHFYFAQMPKIGLALTVIGGISFVIFQSKWLKIASFVVFLSAFLALKMVKKPDILIDESGSFFALYDDKKGLIFSKKLRESKKRKLWLEKMQENEFKYFDKFDDLKGIFCSKEFCKVDFSNYFNHNLKGKMLAVKKRMKEEEICQEKWDLVLNLTKKYKMPKCVAKSGAKLIENVDFMENGTHFIYLKDDDFEIETILN
jgi:competence protein ComEC